MVEKKKVETCTFKLNIRENRILLLTGGGATCRHYAYSIHVSFVFFQKFVCDVIAGYAYSKLILSEIN